MSLDDGTLEQLKCAAAEGHRQVAEQQGETDQRQHVGEERAGRPAPPHLGEVLRRRDFRLLWTGHFVSLLGDQFFVVALPWLILQLTGTAFAIGTVVAVGAAPRTIFILLGGALTDRFSPRTLMLYSNLGRMGLVGILAILTATGMVEVWMLYAFSLLLGLGYAFYLPAQSAIVPRMVPERSLQAGNAIFQGTTQLSLFLGPIIAGILIAVLGDEGGTADGIPAASGIAIVLALDALGFLVSSITLAMIKVPDAPRDESGDTGRDGVFRSLAQALGHVWRDRALRLYFVLIGVVNLALLGAIAVGIPVLAATRFEGGAFAYGAILSGLGAGALVGVVAAGALRRPPGRAFAAAMLGSCALLGAGLALLGAVTFTGAAVAAAFLIGLAEGYLVVEFITWLQIRTSARELGRMLSILLFVSVGMAPVSNLIFGTLIGLNPPLVMMAAGGLIIFVALIAALSPSVWRLSEVGAPAGRPTHEQGPVDPSP